MPVAGAAGPRGRAEEPHSAVARPVRSGVEARRARERRAPPECRLEPTDGQYTKYPLRGANPARHREHRLLPTKAGVSGDAGPTRTGDRPSRRGAPAWLGGPIWTGRGRRGAGLGHSAVAVRMGGRTRKWRRYPGGSGHPMERGRQTARGPWSGRGWSASPPPGRGGATRDARISRLCEPGRLAAHRACGQAAVTRRCCRPAQKAPAPQAARASRPRSSGDRAEVS